MPYNFVADSFHTKKLCSSTFYKRCAILYQNLPFCAFEPPLGDLGATYDNHLRQVGKRVLDFLLVLVEFVLLVLMAEALRANIRSKSAISFQQGPIDPKFQVEWVAPNNHSSQKTRLNDLS